MSRTKFHRPDVHGKPLPLLSKAQNGAMLFVVGCVYCALYAVVFVIKQLRRLI
jgi:hypothetical protein